jgi:predicted secreted protein
MYKLDKHPSCDKVDVQTWQTPIKFVHLPCHMMGVCQDCTSTLSHDGRLACLYIYLVTWWEFVNFVHLPCHMMGVCQVCMYKLDKRPSCEKVDVQTWQTPIMWQGRCTNLTNTHHVMMGVCQVFTSTVSHDGCLSSLYIYLVTWWVFVKFVHLPCHMMGVCQDCTSTLSHDGCLSSLYIYLVTWWVFVKFVHPSCDKVDVQTWQTPIMWQSRCTNLTNTHHVTR